MLLDILIFVPVLCCILFGIRDGIVRKLVAIIVMIAGLIVGQLYMHDVGTFLTEHAGASQENAPLYGFLTIFIGLIIVQGFIYRVIAKNYKIGGFADRIGGLVLGFIEGIVFTSSMFFIFAMVGFPDHTSKRDSQFYKSIVNIAPQILDMTTSLGSDSFEKIEEIGNEKVKSLHHFIDSSAVVDKRKQVDKIDSLRETYRKQSP
jgi:uncharacterized membrane protein required for colicin V production